MACVELCKIAHVRHSIPFVLLVVKEFSHTLPADPFDLSHNLGTVVSQRSRFSVTVGLCTYGVTLHFVVVKSVPQVQYVCVSIRIVQYSEPSDSGLSQTRT